jgi:hypothetical protein
VNCPTNLLLDHRISGHFGDFDPELPSPATWLSGPRSGHDVVNETCALESTSAHRFRPCFIRHAAKNHPEYE